MSFINPYAFAAGGGGGFTPADLGATVLAWYQGDLITGSDMDAIGTWEDSTANNNDATQATEEAKPKLRTAYLDGKNVLEFSAAGTRDYLGIGNIYSGKTAGSMFILIERADDPAGETGTTGVHSFGTDSANNHYPYTDGNVYDGWGTDTRKSTGNPTLSLATWRIVNIHSAASDWKFWIDAVSHFSTATNTVAFNSGPVIGASGATSGFYFTGHMAEIVLTDTVLSQADRESMEGYLAWKWGLEANLPGGHPYAGSPP